jgi:hypothetical protein
LDVQSVLALRRISTDRIWSSSRLVVFYPAKYAPLYPIGYKAALGMAIACILFTLGFKWLSLRHPATSIAAIISQDSAEVGRSGSQDDEEKADDVVKGEMPIVPTLKA